MRPQGDGAFFPRLPMVNRFIVRFRSLKGGGRRGGGACAWGLYCLKCKTVDGRLDRKRDGRKETCLRSTACVIKELRDFLFSVATPVLN